MGFARRLHLALARARSACAHIIGRTSVGSTTITAVCVTTLIGCAIAGRPRAPLPAAPFADTLTVSVHEGTELFAVLSPDGTRFAFIVLGQTWMVNATGGQAKAITNVVDDPDEDLSVAWAPDSRRVAVWSTRTGRTRLRVIDAESRAVLRTWEGHDSFDPVWDRARDQLLAVDFRWDSTIVLAFPMEAGQAPVSVRSFARPVSGLAFSPDGGTLAYATPASTGTATPTAASDIWEVNLATGAERRLTADSTLDGYPVYSPDGRWLAFLSERSGSRQIWLQPRGGGNPRPLTTRTEDLELSPLSWLPDSRALAYAAAGTIRVASLDGGAERTVDFTAELRVARWHSLRRPQLPQPGERHQVRGIVTPELSPDGSQVAFAALGDLWVMNVTGGAARRLTRTPTDEIRPRWSPDGTQLAFVVNAPTGERELRVLEVAHPDRVRSTRVPIAAFRLLGAVLNIPNFAWSPDGDRLAYVDANQVGWTDVTRGVVRVVTSITGLTSRSLFASSSSLLGWTADGDSIALATGVFRGSEAYARKEWTVWRVSADSGPAVRSPTPGAYAVGGAWSADLSRAAYADVGRGFQVALGEPGSPVPIADPSPRFHSWSADGRLLLYLSGERLRLLNVRSGQVRTLDVAVEFTVPAAPPALLIRNVRIVDGTGGGASAPSDVLIEGGRIAQIAVARGASLPPGARVIDAGGRTLTPGLFNLHAHQNPGKLFLASYLYHGVTTIRDPGTDAEWMQALRERVEAGEVVAPRIFATGGLVVSLPGMGTSNLRPVDLKDPASTASEIAAIAAIGTDILKPYYRNPLLDAEVSRAAHAAGLPMTSHYVHPGSLARGLDGKEHSTLYNRFSEAPYRDDVVQALRAANTCVTATLVTFPVGVMEGRSQRMPLDSTFFQDSAFRLLYPASVLDAGRALFRQAMNPRLNARSLATWRQREGWDLASMLRLHQAGVRVVTGTDLSSPFDEPGVLLETQLLVLAGFTPSEAIRAATLDAASCLGVERELGSVAVGKRADLLIVDGDPSTDIRDLGRIAWVVLGGAPYTRQEILSSVRSTGPR